MCLNICSMFGFVVRADTAWQIADLRRKLDNPGTSLSISVRSRGTAELAL